MMSRSRTETIILEMDQQSRQQSAPEHTLLFSNDVVTEPEGSTPLIPKPAIGHDPEPVPSTSHPHNLSH
jgi:hypothetical protein